MADSPLDLLRAVGAAAPASTYESQVLDFKRPAETIRRTLEMLADAAVCFANAQGGTIVLGVDDKAESRSGALVGVDASLTIDVVRKGIFDRTRPNLTVHAEERREDGARLLVLSVFEGIEFYANAKGLATRRLGAECLPFPPEQQVEVRRARGQLDWSSEPSDVTERDLSQAEFERVRTLLVRAGRQELAQLRDQLLLAAMGLLTDGGRLTHAAVSLFGSEDAIRSGLPSAGFSYQYRPAPGREATFATRSSRGIPAMVDVCLELIEARAQTRPLNLAGGVQLPLVDYPRDAVREVLVNAFVHRSFSGSGTVDIEHSPDRLTIRSPGGLVAGVTPENILTHPSTPRHRLLGEAVGLLRLAERTGQGIDRAYREMLRIGKEPPVIDDDGLSVRASLAGGIGNDAFVRFVQDLPEAIGTDVEVLITLSLLRTSTSVEAGVLAVAIQRTPAEAQEVLARVAEPGIGLLEPTRRTLRKAFPTYRLRSGPLAALARAVTYRRRTIDQIDEKVIEHVAEYGFVTNRTLQRMFDRDLYGSRNLLNDLRERGLLEKLGTARGGPGVRYGPGPKFPGRRRREPPPN